MKVNEKFLIKLGVYFILIGLFFSLLGFAFSGFNVQKYDRPNQPWYQMIHFE